MALISVLILIWNVFISGGDAIRCYNCNSVPDVTRCQSTTYCGQQEQCFVDRFGDVPYANFTLGCMRKEHCPGQPSKPFNIVGRDLHSAAVPVPRCRECCSTSNCNIQLCDLPNSAPINVSSIPCKDKDNNCAQLNITIGVCRDPQNARSVCQRYCGYCGIVDGAWNVWSSWATCSVTCGTGSTFRFRTCTNPAPAHGGYPCSGTDSETKSCNPRQCPVHGGWASWTGWESCSQSCGIGLKKRHRTCTNPSPSLYGHYCYGDTLDVEVCNGTACNAISPTPLPTPPGPCSDSVQNCAYLNSTIGVCSISQQARTVCKHYCHLCNLVDGHWSDWLEWGSCSVSCNNGTKSRSRTCTNPAPSSGGYPCTGKSNETTVCKDHDCPVHGGWTIWSAWHDCSATCGTGMTLKRRDCTNPRPSAFGTYCYGDAVEYNLCNIQTCAVNGGWSSWQSWGACSKTCGVGIRQRERNCTNPLPANGGTHCIGVTQQHETCSNTSCSEVAFTARLTSGSSSSSQRTIVFNNVITNIGSGYSSSTGMFTAPVPGMYAFSVTIQVYYAYVQIHLLKGSSIIGYMYPYDSNSYYNYDTSSLTVVTRLAKNDTVHVQYYSGSRSSSYSVQPTYSYFTGYLIS